LVKDQRAIINTGAGTTLSTSAPYPIELLPGFNFIANPFNFDIPVTALERTSSQQIELRTYDGSGWVTADSVFSPFEGYIIFNNSTESDLLEIPPGAFQTAPKIGDIAGKVSDRANWSLSISASLGSAQDNENYVVADPNASSGWDTRDRPEPPVFGDYISVYFPHSDWDRIASRYDTDARPISEAGGVWPIEIISARGGAAELEFSGVDLIPADFEVWLRDEYSGIITNLRNMSEITVSIPPEGEPARLSIIIGSKSSVEQLVGPHQELSGGVELFQNYPNPFRAATTISFELPEPALTRLEIFNVLGQRVAVLLDDTLIEAGKSAVVWDGKNSAGYSVASGIYFVRFQAHETVKTSPVMLSR
jgi:hypothetical protein